MGLVPAPKECSYFNDQAIYVSRKPEIGRSSKTRIAHALRSYLRYTPYEKVPPDALIVGSNL